MADTDAGRQAVEALYEAFNTGVAENVQACMHFPLVILAGDAPVILDSPAAFGPDFDALRRTERWQRTTLDRIEVVGSSANRVYCLVELSRFDVDDRRYLTGTDALHGQPGRRGVEGPGHLDGDRSRRPDLTGSCCVPGVDRQPSGCAS